MANDKDQKEVFISYSTKDTELAQFLCNQLEGSGATCWIAPRDIESGKAWADAIVDGLTDVKTFVLLVSEASEKSEEVAKEINLANSMKKSILPVRIETVMLKGAFLYHLSNKQWTDALDPDKFTRFNATVEAVLKSLNPTNLVERNIAAGSVADMAKKLVNSLNQKHRHQLDNINAMFSFLERELNQIELFFPIRIGATGIDLKFIFYGKNSSMEIYADAASNGDPMKWPFNTIIKNNFKKIFPDIKDGGYRWAFITLMPMTKLTTPLVFLPPEKSFEIFSGNVMAFADKVLPKIFEWAEYSREVSNAIKNLEDRLKAMFPEDEGWRIGAPEGERLNGYRAKGKINVYKKTWLPQDETASQETEGGISRMASTIDRGRGWLSITLESGGVFLDNIYIGILKYEPWLELGEFKDRLITEGNKEAGQTETPEDWWPWWQRLDAQWRSSGIGQAEAKWKDRLKEFVDYCLGRFENIKKLEHLLDEACAAIPALQIKDPRSFSPEMQQKWEASYFYAQNCTRIIAEEIQKEMGSKYPEVNLQSGYLFRGGNAWKDVYLKVKVANFDAAIAFRFDQSVMKTECVNLEPPDFETLILKNYFAKRNSDKILQETVKMSSEYATVAAWIERFQQFVKGKLDVIIPELVAFKAHLEKVVALTKLAEKEISSILTPEEDWTVTNEASSLEKSKAIMFWHKSWLREGAQPKELPPLVFQIYADSPCFDNLYLSVKYEAKALSELERKIGAVCGASDFAFRTGDSPAIQGIWSRKLDTFHLTGGSSFERTLIDGDERSSFTGYLRGIAEQVKKMEPIIAGTCQLQHDLEFVSEIGQFIDALATEIAKLFPEQEGWKTTRNIPDIGKPYGSIAFYKKTWQMPGQERGNLSFFLEGEGENFDNLIYGVVKASDKMELLPESEENIKQACEKMVEIGGTCKPNNWWPWYQKNNNFKTTGGANRQFVKEEKLAAMKEYYLKVFKEMKEKLVPVIDTIYPDKNAVKQQLCQKPADELKDMPDTMVNNNG